MKKLLSLKSQITEWLTFDDYRHWKTLFLALSILLCLVITHLFEFDSTIFTFALVTSVFISWSISDIFGVATVRIYSPKVFLGWGFINYSFFVMICSLFVSKEEWGIDYILGFVIAFIFSLLLVKFCSYISYLLKLNDDKEDESIFRNRESKFNGCIFYTLIAIFSLIYFIDSEGIEMKKYKKEKTIEQQNIQYQKETWQPVTEWHTEILHGNTIYIVKCKKGRLGIYPSKYPQIRDINNNTQIKYLAGETKEGLILPIKLEIKN